MPFDSKPRVLVAQQLERRTSDLGHGFYSLSGRNQGT